MIKKLVTRSAFARLCGVSPAAVTNACKAALLPACVGKKIDAAHPSAVAYHAEKTAPKPEHLATGLDPLYEQAVAACHEAGRWSVSHIQRSLRVGYNRATAMRASMDALGVVPDTDARPPTPPSPCGLPTPPPREPRQRPAPTPEETGVLEFPEDIQAFGNYTLFDLVAQFGTDDRFVGWLNATQKIEAINEKRLKNAQTEGRLVSRELVKTAIIDRIEGVFVQMLTDGAKTIGNRAHAMAKAGADAAEVREMVEDLLGSFIRPAKVKMREALRHAED